MTIKNIKRGTAILLAFLMCFTVFSGAITGSASAATESGMVYLNIYPASGDSSSASAWSHSNLKYMNGWQSGAGSELVLRAIGSFTGTVCYCIEPGAPQNSGETLTKYDESYWDKLPASSNKTISPENIKLLIGRILQYGYTGTISPDWKTQNAADADKMAKIYATQILIWETIVGERDELFNHVSTGSADKVIDLIGANHPLKSRIMSHYNSIVSGVQNHTKIPSFTAKAASEAQTVSLKWDGEKYSAVVNDSNGVLSNFTFTANGLTFAKDGNKLTVTAKEAPKSTVTVNAEKQNAQRKGLVSWSDGKFGPGNGRQDIVGYESAVADPVKAVFKVNVAEGALKLIKTSDDGKVSGISFSISGEGTDINAVTDENGVIEIPNLKPGTYTVSENTQDNYVKQEPQTVVIEVGKTAEVKFNNITKCGSVEVTKVDEQYPDNRLSGAVFEIYSDTDSNGEFDADTDTVIGIMEEKETGVYRMDDLRYGGYFLYEQEAPEGFVKDDGYYYFKIENDGETVTVENKAGVGFINRPATSKLVITKTDIADGKLLPDAGFRIKDSDGNVVAEGYTDENGIAEFTLRCGKYTYEEFDAPTGYRLDTEPHEFEVCEDGSVIKADITNEKLPDIPKTGDDSNMAVWIAAGSVCLIAAAAAAVQLYRKKNSGKKDD